MMRREWSLPDPAATRPRVAEHAFRIGACSLISILRASLVWFYFDIVGLMMGSADGPFNLLLNALAMGFVLELDDVLQPDLPSQNFFGVNHPRLFQLYEERTARARATLAAAARVARVAPAGLRRAYHACSWITPTVVVVVVIANAWLLQKATTKGTLMTFDDDSAFGGRRETMTLTYNWMIYVLLLALLWPCSFTSSAVPALCDDWAAAGECTANPVFMQDECGPACKCANWAASGECGWNAAYMKTNCANACTLAARRSLRDMRRSARRADTNLLPKPAAQCAAKR